MSTQPESPLTARYDSAEDALARAATTSAAVAAAYAACAAVCREAGCICYALAAGDGAARFTNCPECNGKGWHYGDCHPRETCGICNGEGAVVEVHDPRCPDALASRIEAQGKG